MKSRAPLRPLAHVLVLALAFEVGLSCARDPALRGHGPNVVRAPVPIISQATSYSCGAAALLAVLVYFGVFDGPENDLHGRLGVTPEEGTHPDRIVDVARERGLTVEKRTGFGLEGIERALEGGAVVILAIQAWPEERQGGRRAWEATWDDGHYVVAVGLDAQNLYVMDPSVRGSYGFIPRDELLRRWHDFEVQGGRRVEYKRLGIVVRGEPRLRRFPEAPARVE